jgi:hypothetical protein
MIKLSKSLLLGLGIWLRWQAPEFKSQYCQEDRNKNQKPQFKYQ